MLTPNTEECEILNNVNLIRSFNIKSIYEVAKHLLGWFTWNPVHNGDGSWKLCFSNISVVENYSEGKSVNKTRAFVWKMIKWKKHKNSLRNFIYSIKNLPKWITLNSEFERLESALDINEFLHSHKNEPTQQTPFRIESGMLRCWR